MGKTVFITGGSRGIGAETAKVFAENGFNVVISYNREISLAKRFVETYSSLNPENFYYAVKLDLTSVISIDDAAEEVKKILNNEPLDVFVSNAGVLRTAPFAALKVVDILDMYHTNSVGATLLAKRIVRFKPTSMIFVGSDLSKDVKEGCSVYSASKAALRALVNSLVLEKYPAYFVNPDTTKTEMTDNQGREPEVVANVIFATACGDYGEPSGKDIDVWEVVGAH